MATQAKAHATGPGVLKFGTGEAENDFSCQVSNVKITPDFDSDDSIPVLCGGEVPGEVAYSAELEAEFLQDFDADGCLAWSWANAAVAMIGHSMMSHDLKNSRQARRMPWRTPSKPSQARWSSTIERAISAGREVSEAAKVAAARLFCSYISSGTPAPTSELSSAT